MAGPALDQGRLQARMSGMALDSAPLVRLRRFIGHPCPGASRLAFLRSPGMVLIAAATVQHSAWLGATGAAPRLQDLGVAAGHSPASVHTALATAQVLNLLTRVVAQDDHRRVSWEPTAEGRALFLEYATSWTVAMAELTGHPALASRLSREPGHDLLAEIAGWMVHGMTDLRQRDPRYLTRAFAATLWDLGIYGADGVPARHFIATQAAALGVSQQTIRLKLETAQGLGLVRWTTRLELTADGEAWVKVMVAVLEAQAIQAADRLA